MPSLNARYQRKIALFGKSIMWDIYVKVDNLFDDRTMYVQRAWSDGSARLYRFFPPRSFTVFSRVSFTF
jgi:hypothetical protein